MIRVLREDAKRTTSQIRQLVEDYAQKNNLRIPAEIYTNLLATENRETGKITIVELHPSSTETVIAGGIRAVNSQVNFYKRLGYAENQMSSAILGKLVVNAFVEVTIREDRNAATGVAIELTCFFPMKSFKSAALSVGASVVAYVEARTLPNGVAIWIATEIYKRE